MIEIQSDFLFLKVLASPQGAFMKGLTIFLSVTCCKVVLLLSYFISTFLPSSWESCSRDLLRKRNSR